MEAPFSFNRSIRIRSRRPGPDHGGFRGSDVRRRPKTLVIDIDSLPVEVHGEQPGSAWNGYYHRRVYHPIVASAGEMGDILDLRLREGQVHTADGGLEFVLEVLERAEGRLCGKPSVRFDAGYPGELLMAALEERGTHYVARVRNNAVLKRDAVVWDALHSGLPAGEPRTWVCESSYPAGSWSRSRRVVLEKNAHRRHMTAEQRAAVVLLAADWMPPHRPAAKDKGDTVSPLSNDAAAARAGVSKRTIQRVKAQIQAGHGEALATGSETLRSLAAKARKAASAEARENAGKAGGDPWI